MPLSSTTKVLTYTYIGTYTGGISYSEVLMRELSLCHRSFYFVTNQHLVSSVDYISLALS